LGPNLRISRRGKSILASPGIQRSHPCAQKRIGGGHGTGDALKRKITSEREHTSQPNEGRAIPRKRKSQPDSRRGKKKVLCTKKKGSLGFSVKKTLPGKAPCVSALRVKGLGGTTAGRGCGGTGGVFWSPRPSKVGNARHNGL